MPDAHKNFAASSVLTAPVTPTAGTSLVLATGGGALMPLAPFNATVWPAAVGASAANAEIVRVTAISTDTLTIARAQEGSVARTIVAGDQFAATITVKTLTDAESTLANNYKGAWNPAADYVTNDVVTYLGATWRAPLAIAKATSPIASDSFNRADAVLTNSLTEIGGFTWSSGAGGWSISGNTLKALNTVSNGWPISNFVTLPSYADVRIKATLAGVPADSSTFAGKLKFLLRFNTGNVSDDTNADAYVELFKTGANWSQHTTRLVYPTSNGGAIIAVASTIGVKWLPGDVIEVLLIGTTATVFRNGTSVITGTVKTTIDTSRAYGIHMVSPPSTEFALDDVSFSPTVGTFQGLWELLAAKGDAGAAGPAGLTAKGAFDPTLAYITNDVVTFAGSTYRATSAAPAGVAVFADDFNRADGALGNGWTVANGTCTVVANQAMGGGSGCLVGRTVTALNGTVQMKLVSISSSIIIRGDGWNDGVRIQFNAGGYAVLDALNGTQITTGGTAFAVNDVVKVSVTGTNYTVFRNSVQEGTFTTAVSQSVLKAGFGTFASLSIDDWSFTPPTINVVPDPAKFEVLAAVGAAGVAAGYNILSYGASTGATAAANTTAINAAITAAAVSGGLVYIPAGTYLHNGSIVLKDKVTLAGDGRGISVLKAADDASASTGYISLINNDIVNGNSDIHLRDFTVDGNYAGRPSSIATAVRLIASDVNACNRVSLDRVEIKGAAFGDLQLMNCVDFSVDNCLIRDAKRDGITVWFNSRDGRISNNRVSGVRDDCIALNCEGTGHTGTIISNVTITGNALEQAADSVNGNGISNAGGVDVTISGNTVIYTQGWGIIAWGGINSGATMPATRTTITGNTIKSAGVLASNGGGIEAHTNSISTTITGNTVEATYNTAILMLAKATCTGNTVRTGKTVSTIGISAQAKFCTVVSNVLDKVQHYGVQVLAEKVVVSGNSFEDCALGQVSGAYIVVQASRASIIGNVMHRVTGTAGAFGVRIASGATTFCIVSGNLVQGFTLGNGISNGSTGQHTIVGNSEGPQGLDIPVTKTAAYTALPSDFIEADATTAGFTVTLPTTPLVGSAVTVKKTDASVNVVTVASTATIDGATSVLLATQWQSMRCVYDGTRWVTVGGSGVAGSSASPLLASVSYNPAAAEIKSTISVFNVGGWVDVDATNIAVTFVAPASGTVIVTTSGYVDLSANAATLFWALRQGTTTLADTGCGVLSLSASSALDTRRVIAEWKITGLTSGASYTYKLAHSVSANTGRLYVGGGNANPNGPCVMKVWAA